MAKTCPKHANDMPRYVQAEAGWHSTHKYLNTWAAVIHEMLQCQERFFKPLAEAFDIWHSEGCKDLKISTL